VQVHVVEVKPLRLGVELQGYVVFLGGLKYLLEVNIDRRTRLDLPACGVGEDMHGRMRQCLEYPSGHPCLRHVETRVDGDQDDVELFEHLVGQIQRPVRQDVELNPFEQDDAVEPLADLLDLLPLLAKACGVKTAGHSGGLAVIGDGAILVAALPTCSCHLLDRMRAITPLAVHL
jgi:hypothetical protein